MEAKIVFDEEMIKSGETREEKEFGFFRILRGLFVDGKDLADEVNAAIADAYAEN